MAVGLHPNPAGLLLDKALRAVYKPITHYCHDPSHTMWISGVFNTLFYVACETLVMGGKGPYEGIELHLNGWVLPHECGGKSDALKDVFSSKRVSNWRTARHIKCSGSDALGLYRLLNVYFTLYVAPGFPRVCEAIATFTLLADLMCEQAYRNVTSVELMNAVRAFLLAFKRAGWAAYMHPKFHRLWHFAKILADLGFMPNCLTLERKHKLPKRYSLNHNSLHNYSTAILEEVTYHALHVLKADSTFDASVHLVNSHMAGRKLRTFVRSQFGLGAEALAYEEILTSQTARFGIRGSCQCGGVCLVREGGVVSVVELWALVDFDTPMALASL